MQTLLVVMCVDVLPLGFWFDSEEFDEVLDLDLVVFAAEGLACAEEPIFLLCMFEDVCRRPRVIIDLLLVVVAVVAVVLLATLFILVSILVIITAFLAVELLVFLLLWVGVLILDDTVHGW